MARPTHLTKELTTKIRDLVLKSIPYNQIQEILEIPTSTWDTWILEDYLGFRGKVNQWKKERIVKKAEAKVEALIEAEDDRVALQAATFALETLGRDDYSKRTETTGKDGKELTVVIAGESAERFKLKNQ